MAGVELVDETFISASPARVARIVADPSRWRPWFPGMRLTIFMDRGESGIRWSVTGTYAGSTEIWLEPFGDGVIVHYYLRVQATPPFPDTPAGYRAATRARVEKAKHWKKLIWSLKDELEAGREPGLPATG